MRKFEFETIENIARGNKVVEQRIATLDYFKR